MANQEQRDILRQGVEVWNRYREANPIVQVDLRWMTLSAADLDRANLAAANLGWANLRRANLSGAKLSKASLTGTDLTEANLSEADLSGATLFEADHAESQLVKTLLKGANFSNEATFDCTMLGGANLRAANLNGAKLHETNLTGANLSGADLSRANLSWANLSDADFTGANLEKAVCFKTTFANTNLSRTLGLGDCEHLGPSTVDHRTLARSGLLPISFLRGCGLPDQFIDYLPSLVQQAIQFYSCFISYSSKDQAFAERLHADLQNKGVRCWFAPHNIKGGEKIHEQIDAAIRIYDRLLLILSDASMNSEWVKTEIAKARRKELSQRTRVLFPVSLVPYEAIRAWDNFDADTGKDSAREIREYFIPDFSNWKSHDSYQEAFDRLLRDLKAE